MPLSKSELSEQICRIGEPGGPGGIPSLTDGAIAPLADEFGRLITVADSGGVPGTTSPIFYSTGGSRVTQAAVGTPSQAKRLSQVAGYNADTVQLFVQIHEVAASPIVNGAVPVVIIPVPGLFGTFSYGLLVSVVNPAHFFVVAISTTELTFTAPVSDFLWFSAMYFTS
jgi:hypothetical protein